mmetsp:Transcript_10283/g.15298  ORF Transcript_10283/g.15298 Transcript_10283/m.15298 type:complete len:167 (+) Transcript_10283:795-1295(+)
MVKPMPSKFSSATPWFGSKTDEMSPKESDDNTSISLSSIPSWINENKKGIVASSAIMTAVALTLPSASFATSLAEVGTNGEALAASASTVMDKFAATGFYQAFSLVFLSEIGDKTFFHCRITRNENFTLRVPCGICRCPCCNDCHFCSHWTDFPRSPSWYCPGHPP